MTPNLWNNTYTLFLFDRQLIYCKKDLLKRTNYLYKGRIFLDNCRILNLPDGKIFGVTLKNALRIYCDTRNKWFDFCFRSGSSKLRFLNTLSAERQFCGQSLFVSELAGLDDDTMLSDREYGSDRGGGGGGVVDYSSETNEPMMTLEDGTTVRLLERAIDVENINTMNLVGGNSARSSNSSRTTIVSAESQPTGKYKKSDTLPKKSRKLHKEPTITSYEYHSNSLGRKKLGNWFRKAKSTNTTPSHSPTHHPLALAAMTNSAMAVSTVTPASDDSSSESSPAMRSRSNMSKDVNDGTVVAATS